ncbi:MAG: hypothetical protein Ct9H300mP21_10970 [Pseudomonadota bacterium]|nr:MAG: hypothetical protein Ct9H300mP21_10970 [Pseudomonadota bacterium]
MKRGIGLAWVRNEMAETGNNFTIRLANGSDVVATVLDHSVYDPEGLRLKKIKKLIQKPLNHLKPKKPENFKK